MRAIFAAFVIVFWAGLATWAQAQDTMPDYDTWENRAKIFEQALTDPSTRSEILLRNREQIAEFRNIFRDAQTAGADRIDTVNDQIQALGPMPDGDGAEAPDVAQRRSALNQQLADLRAPQLRAEEAFARADGMIHETDRQLTQRQVNRIFSQNPMPWLPGNFVQGTSDFWHATTQFVTETRRGWVQVVGPAGLYQFWGGWAVFALVAALFARGRGPAQHWAMAGLRPLSPEHGARFARLMITTGFAVAVFGVFYIIQIPLVDLGKLGIDALAVQQNILWICAGLAFALWVALHYDLVGDEQAERGPLRRWFLVSVMAMAVLTSGFVLIQTLIDHGLYTPTAVSVIQTLYVLAMAPLMYRMGRMLVMAAQSYPGWVLENDPNFGMVKYWLGRGLMAVSLASPIAALLGFGVTASGLTYASVLTLGLVLGLFILSRGLRDGLTARFGVDASEPNGLWPILWNTTLIVGAIPALALIWGARVSDLSELWQSFKAGVQLGETTLSPSVIATLIVVFLLGYMVTRLIKRSLQQSILPRTKIEAGAQNALVSGVGYLGLSLAAVIALSTAGINFSSLAIVAGALSIGVGFGLQNIVSNFVSGIILLIERPIRVGDWIEVGGMHGTVREISVRSTRIEAFDRSDLIVPNADLISGTVANYTRGNTVGRVIIPVGVAYGTDTRQVETLLLDIAKTQPMVLDDPAPSVVFQGFGADSMDFELRCILRDINWGLSVRSEINHLIAERFADAGIEIPFAQREITVKNMADVKAALSPKDT